MHAVWKRIIGRGTATALAVFVQSGANTLISVRVRSIAPKETLAPIDPCYVDNAIADAVSQSSLVYRHQTTRAEPMSRSQL